MGVNISNWRLASVVSRMGQLGVVSGTALDTVLVRTLQNGDPFGHIARALDHFPVPSIAKRIVERYYIPGGKKSDAPYKRAPLFTLTPPRFLQELTVAANFVEVWLAKEGHDQPVGINLMEKIALPNIYSLYGAMLAGVDYVLMGAGIPSRIPGVLDRLARHEEAALAIPVDGARPAEQFTIRFDPRSLIGDAALPMKRPRFLAIVSSFILADHLIRKSNGRVDGVIIEDHTAGGHNAPPRGTNRLVNEHGEPVYGPRDTVDLAQVKSLGLPFWVAGSTADPEILQEVVEKGACGIQVGTLLACCEESAMAPQYKQALIEQALAGQGRVFTDPRGSATGFPFKTGQLNDTMSQPSEYECRPRICDLGYLRQPYRKEDGKIGYRCPAEPVEDYLAKGGRQEDTIGRKCLCNGLLANVGLGQVQASGYVEKALITIGADMNRIARIIPPGRTTYTASDVLRYLLGDA